MKQHLSVFGLAVRGTLYKTAALCLAAALAQIGFCLYFLRSGSPDAPLSLEQLIGAPSFARIAGVAFLAICALLCFSGCDRGGTHSIYTLRRLRVSERAAVLWAAVSNAGMLALLWASQLAAVLIIELIRMQFLSAAPDPQTLLIAFYRCRYLHALLPLREISLLVRNLLLLLALALCCAAFSYHQRRGHFRLEPLVLALFVLFFFPQQLGSFGSDVMLMLVALAGIAVAVYSLWGGVSDETAS